MLITIPGPIAGAHVNPAVTLAALACRDIGKGDAAAYSLAQLAGGGIPGRWAAGTILAAMLCQWLCFDETLQAEPV